MSIQKKPPVVTIMGHVDHGKTTLLDYIRKTNLAAKEYGEITQAISAYQVIFQGGKITFVDTPGHEAFSQMRARGAGVADLVVLVISAIDGVKPQTKESIKVIKESQVPFLVAINKIDLAGASIDKVKGQLAENEVLVEGYGGKVVAVPISAKTGEGVDQLLEMILLTADMLELKADRSDCFAAEIIESKADKYCGSLISLIVKNGSLKKSDLVVVGDISGKVKLMRDWRGELVDEALPGDPVVILGFEGLPPVGSIVYKPGEEVEGKACRVLPSIKAMEVETEGKIKIILKTDVVGSMEAILGCLPGEVAVMEQSVGEISDSDVMKAKSYGAEIIGFNLTVSMAIEKLAEMEKVKIRTYKIIYELLKDLEDRILKILEPTIDRNILGKAEVLAGFEIKGEKIIGCRVVEGKINKSQPVCLQRGNQILVETRIKSLKQGKQDINEAEAGVEFGAVLAKNVDFQVGDVLISYSL